MEFHRWPWVQGHLAFSDFVGDLRGGWVPGVEDFGFLGSVASNLANINHRLLSGCAALAVLGFLIGLGRPAVGGVVIAFAALAGAGVMTLVALDVRLLDRFGHGCGPAPLALHSPEILASVRLFGESLFACAAALWLWVQRRMKATRVSALLGIAIAAVMLWVVEFDARPSTPYDWFETPPSLRLLPLAVLVLAGLVLSLTRPLFVSRIVAAGVLFAGMGMLAPAIAVAHDQRLETHERRSGSEDEQPVLTKTCGETTWNPLVVVGRDEVTVRWQHLEPTWNLEQRASEAFDEQFGEIRALRGPAQFARVNLVVNAEAELDQVQQTLRALQRSGISEVALVSFRREEAPTWTHPAIHWHECTVVLELKGDVRPMSTFVDWPSVVHEVDLAGGRLALTP